MRKFFKRPKRVALLLAGLVVVGAVAWFIIESQSQVSGTITTHYRNTSDTYGTATLKSPTFSFVYSTRYQQQTPASADSNLLEQYKLVAATAYDKELTVIIKKLPTGQLKDDSDYNLRATFPDQYELQDKQSHGQPATVAVKRDNTAQNIFIPHGNKLAIISFTTSGARDDLNAEVATALQNFTWSQ